MKLRTPFPSIRKRCLDCTCYSPKVVRECELTECSLFPYRMGKRPPKECLPHTGDNDIEINTPKQAIRNYCIWCMGWRGGPDKRRCIRLARECDIADCPIWHLRPGQKTPRKANKGQLQRTYAIEEGKGTPDYLEHPQSEEMSFFDEAL